MTREDEASNPEPLGEEGDACAQCGTKLAVDQRYCLNCGTPRAEPRLDYQRHLAAGGGASGSGPARAGAGGGGVQWSPLFVVLAIAALGVMLLLGVLIGKDDNEVTVTEVPASTTTTATAPATTTTPTTTSTPTTPTATTPSGTEGTTSVPETPGDGGAQRKNGTGGSGGLAPGGTD